MVPRVRGLLLVSLAFNLVFLAHLLLSRWIGPESVLRALTTNLILLISPLALCLPFKWRPSNGHEWLAATFLSASVVSWFAPLLLKLTGLPAQLEPLLLLYLAIGDLSLLLAAARGQTVPGVRASSPKRWVPAVVLSLVGFVCVTYGSWKIVEPMIDIDFEAGGPSHGLVTSLKPSFGYGYYLFHPPLLHMFIADSVVLSGRIDDVARYDDHGAWQRSMRATSEELYHSDELYFGSRPDLVHIYRTLCPGLAIMAAWAIGILVTRIVRSSRIGCLCGILYLLCPEAFIRSCSTSYTSITNLFAATTVLILFFSRPNTWGNRVLLFGCAFICIWADHKTLVLALAILIHVSILWARGSFGEREKRLWILTALLGFAGGWLSWCAYGLWVSPTDFIETHLVEHCLGRISFGTEIYYPGLQQLWTDFAFSMGYPFLLLALAGLIRAARSGDPGRFIFIWFLCGAAAFSLVDWKQTKHLLTLTPALSVGFGAVLAAARGRASRIALVVVVGFVVGYDLFFLWHVVQNFAWFTPAAGW